MSNAWKIPIGIIVVGVVILAVYFAVRAPSIRGGQGGVSDATATIPSPALPQGKGAAPITPNVKTMNYTQATIDTNMGSFTISFDPKLAPNTVANFEKLASSGFYDKVKFHRVIAGFMIQGGDPLSKDDGNQAAWGTGGPGYQFPDEITADSKNVVGAVAMANSGPNTNGSQFFVNVADNSYLDGHYSVFGHITSGYDIVEKISKVQTGPNDRPVNPVIIESVTLK